MIVQEGLTYFQGQFVPSTPWKVFILLLQGVLYMSQCLSIHLTETLTKENEMGSPVDFFIGLGKSYHR